MNKRWYALYVRPRFEKLAQSHLEHKGYEVFLPTYSTTRSWSDRVKSLSLPLFPGYVFCRFDIQERLPILITPGVQFVVGIDRTPQPVGEDEISAIRRLGETGTKTKPCAYPGNGEPVRVVAGPLDGLTGIVVRAKGSHRLIVSVALLRRSVSVEIDERYLEPLPAEHPTLPRAACS